MIMWYILRQYWETHFGNVDIFLKKKEVILPVTYRNIKPKYINDWNMSKNILKQN